MAAAPNPRRPLYLARQSYRRRRMMDAARLLPVLGAVLMLMPLLWMPSGGALDTARTKFYLFALWLLLIIVAALLSHPLIRSEDDEPDARPPGDESGPG
ncbi:hypothetical protein ACFQXB_07485 [Plastorhodobacter daqingensis]|uniref:DUF3311 domain-containing protein n=1 Tax=Plastorhodobacter daqingensis TaxID=1387281 RepID=A0ABW2UH86_9RHOB